MLGMFDILPYLKGWEYKLHSLKRSNVVRGAAPITKRISETGWLISMTMLSTDCYGIAGISWQGAALETNSFSGDSESAMVLGALSQDPAGWVQRYFRPNPDSTAGVFFGPLFTGGFQGSAWPYVPTVIMSISLPTDSTQTTAYVGAQAITIAITNKKLWLKSLRSLLGIKGKIDPALLEIGLTQMTEDILT